MQVPSRSIGRESSYGYKVEEETTQQANCAKVEVEEKNGGNREGFS